MQSLNQFNSSLNELKSVEKKLGMATVTINMRKLDDVTKERLIQAILEVTTQRKSAIMDVLQGAN